MDSDKSTHYQITVSGEIDPGWSDWLGALSIHTYSTPGGQRLSRLTGPVPDQPALRGILIQIWDLNLELISVQKIEAMNKRRKIE